MPAVRFFPHLMLGFMLSLVVFAAQLSSDCDLDADDCPEFTAVLILTDAPRTTSTTTDDTPTGLTLDSGGGNSVGVELAGFWPAEHAIRHWFGPPPSDLPPDSTAAAPPDTPPII